MKWNILNKTPKEKETKRQSKEIIKILLKNRGLSTEKEIKEFLEPTKPKDLSARDLGIEEKEIEKAVKRIKMAINDNERIIVYGDYDADGICATAILWETLYHLAPKVLPYIPERVSEGYGLNKETIQKLREKYPDLKLIITVDHGITAKEKIDYAQKLGLEVIVCDHHQLGKEKPSCAALVHTEKVCAAAIAWFIARELTAAKNKETSVVDNQSTDYLDLVAIATIADLEPLLGINRSFAKFGLEALNKTKRCGLLAIFEEAGIKPGKIGVYEVGYIIAPRLNAMGRLEHALESLRLLCTTNCDKAKTIASKLGQTNKERQMLTQETTKHALEICAKEQNGSKLIFVYHESYNQGIIGLVAGKLVEQYHRPAVVVARGEEYSKASARSINGFNIIEAIRSYPELLVEAGGHPMAAGFTIETTKLEIFKERLTTLANTQIPDEILEKTLKIDLFLPLEMVDFELYQATEQLSPFGLGNPEPIFASKAKIKGFKKIGDEGKHLRILLSSTESPNNLVFSAVGFNQGELADQLKVDQEVEIAYTLVLNEWDGQKRIELKLKDLRCPTSTS